MKRKIWVGAAGAVLGIVTAGSVASTVWIYQKVRQFDATYGCRVLSGLSPDQLKADAAVCREIAREQRRLPSSGSSAAEPAATNLTVQGVEVRPGGVLRVWLSGHPDETVMRDYVTVEPLIQGAIGISPLRGEDPGVQISGDFAYRTNVTLRIRKGLPAKAGAAQGALLADYVYTFQRPDAEPYAKYAAQGRYLPSVGSHALAVETMNVTNLQTSICRVEPANVVQLLAREEGVYRMYLPMDKGATAQLAGEASVQTNACGGAPNTLRRTLLPVSIRDGGPARGIYLTALLNVDRSYEYSWEKECATAYRLVCVTDFGLSVRRGKEALHVWATSLTTGRPRPGAVVAVYSSANVRLAEGVTDARGRCDLPLSAKAEPFAVVVSEKDGSDRAFLALRDSMKVDESTEKGTLPDYLAPTECAAFVWTERGIYRHDEPIFAQALLRNGQRRAPRPFPVEFALMSPEGRLFATKTCLPDAQGALACDKFTVPADQPSGQWRIVVRTPGKDGRELGAQTVKVEEFAPPQIRVRTTLPESAELTNLAFTVAAEHLFGGPARRLKTEGALVFEDAPFAPAAWKAYAFGDENRGLKPSFRRLGASVLDEEGQHAFRAPFWASLGLPKACVRVTVQGTVFEDGGRPATARASKLFHYYPYYIGAALPSWLKKPVAGQPRIPVVCVRPDGKPLSGVRELSACIRRVDTVNTYKVNASGTGEWESTRVATKVAEFPFKTDAQGAADLALPIVDCADYTLTIADRETNVSFSRAFYLSDWGDEAVRTPLGRPTEVTLTPDKPYYRPGDVPRLTVRAPFAGWGFLTVQREKVLHVEVLELTNATSEVVLPRTETAWAPNVHVTLSVVQSVEANARHLAARAHGKVALPVRPAEDELPVRVAASVRMAPSGESQVVVDVSAASASATGLVASVALVDEGINLLTDGKTPDPAGWFGKLRETELPLYDLFDKVLPVAGEIRHAGVKTGGGFGAEMLSRVSPVPTRRFKPLALWKARVALTNGAGRTTFKLPEFAGEVRVTAVAWSATATGAAKTQCKVAPKLVMQPDAPRFAAPGDRFQVTLPLHNTTTEAGRITYRIGAVSGACTLAGKGATNIVATVTAPSVPGEWFLAFAAEGLGEKHVQTLHIPIRPAVPWEIAAGLVRLEPGETRTFAAEGAGARLAFGLEGSPLGELAAALEWLADYPYGCLEQTCSRIFPLISAGGILSAVGSAAATNRLEYVQAGVRRVESMIRANDFTMWPDCNEAPWDREVSLYAAHFLVEAAQAGVELVPAGQKRVLDFLREWASETNTATAAYACHTLALAGTPDRDRMFRLYDGRANLSALSRARLARAFALLGDVPRARALLAESYEPQSVTEASFTLLALLAVDPDDSRIPPLLSYLLKKRDKQRFCWGTTSENAQALLAIGAYWRHHPPKEGTPRVRISAANGAVCELSKGARRVWEGGPVAVSNTGSAPAFLSWERRTLPDVATVTNISNGLVLKRRFLRPTGEEASLDDIACGEMLVVELSLGTTATRKVSDLVIEDLFAGAFEPVHSELDPSVFRDRSAEWVLRKDARDDRMLVFSKEVTLKKGDEVKICYPVRVVSAGDFVLPGAAVEGMYNPSLRARCAPARLVVDR